VIIDRFDLIRPVLNLLPPELAHAVTVGALRLGLGGDARRPDDPILASSCFGLAFSNPLGLAAGFDKNAKVIRQSLQMGFGFSEFGTVTPQPQKGNPHPRIFRLPAQRAVINRLGFNNQGLDSVGRQVTALSTRGDIPGRFGGNIGRNKDSPDAVADYVTGASRLSPFVDYLTVNVSSPNTPGLRALQSRAALTELLAAVLAARQRPIPVLVKIAPDLTEDELQDIAQAAIETGIAGIIVSNTTISRPDTVSGVRAAESGGLSGPPLFPLATDALRAMYRLTGGTVPLIGVGGIASADDAYIKIRAGASLLQLYTALIYEGPRLVTRIKTGLAARLRADGFTRLSDAVGADFR
jgi:dihydroorotate dehydrogenase